MTTTTILDLNGSDPSTYGEYGIGPHVYWPNTSPSGSVTFSRAQHYPFYAAQLGLASGVRTILIAPDQNASDLGGVQLDWRLGWHQTQASGELNYTAPRVGFGASSSPQSYSFWSGGTSYTVSASTVARQVTPADAGGTSKTLYDLKLETSTPIPSSAMQDLLRQVGIEYRQGSTPPVHQRDIDLTVKISADGTNFVGAPAGQAGTLKLELDNTPSFPLQAIYGGKVVVLSFGSGALALADLLLTLSDTWEAKFGQPLTSLFGLEVRPAGAAGPVDTSFTITEVLLERQAFLVLNKAIPAGAQVKVSYSDPAGNQISNVVQDWRGNDASSSNGWITASPLTTGRTLTALAGAELGISTGDEYAYGLYWADADGAGIKGDSVVRITAVDTAAGTYTAEMRPSLLFPNPSYDPAAAADRFQSYRYSNEAVSAQFKPKAGQPLPVVGSTSTLLELLKQSDEPLLLSYKSSVLAARTESVAAALVFDLFEVGMPPATGLPLGLAIAGLASAIGDDTLSGSPNSDTLEGWWGNDAIAGGDGDDTLDGGAGNDYLQGGAGPDVLYGGSGNDVLSGYEDYDDSQLVDPLFAAVLQGEKLLTDSLYGGAGDDFYILDQFAGPTLIFELDKEGSDTVLGGFRSYVLAANVENYINDLSITENGVPVQIQIQGNSLPNWIQSAPADWDLPLDQLLGSVNQERRSAEAFFGLGGADTLLGGGGDDLLDGGEGNDKLDGGEGIDTAQYRGNRADYEVTSRADGSWTVRDLRLATAVVGGDQMLDGQDTLYGLEWLKFQDATVQTSTAISPVPVRFEANGHWYEFVATLSGGTWTNALAQAATKFHRGQQGYLATITTALENDFVYQAFGAKVPGNGGIAIAGSDAGQEGRWRWMAGPENGTVFGYVNWAAGEPNDSGGTSGWLDNQDYLGYLSPVYMKPGTWADAWNSPNPGSTDIWAGYVVEYGDLPASYTITPSATSVNEGASVTFTIDTKNVEWGTALAYTLAGISAADLASGALTGTAVVNPQGIDGQVTITVSLLADQQTEGTETLTLTVMGQSASVQVSDSSQAKPNLALLGVIPGSAQDIAPGTNLSLQFAAPVRAASGSVVLANLDDAKDHRTISITDTSQVQFKGSTVVINPTADLATDARYSITVSAGAIEDTLGRAYAGTTEASPWTFTTGSITQWQRQYSDQVMDIPNAIALDAEGHIYLVGETVGGIEGANLDGLSYPFVSQFSSSGQLNWVSRFGTASAASSASGSAFALAVDPDGSILVGGELGSATLAGGKRYGLAKYDPTGLQLWLQSGEAQPYSALKELLVAGDHSIVGGGRTYAALSGSTGPTQANNLIVKHDATGNLVWSRVFGTALNDLFWGLAAAGDGGFYASWTSADSAGATQGYLTRFNAQGGQVWQVALGSALDDRFVASVVVGEDGQVYFAGSDRVAGAARGFLAKLSDSGQPLWRTDLGSSQGNYVNFMQLAPDGNLWVSAGSIGADGNIANGGGVSTLVNSHNGLALVSLQSTDNPLDAFKQISNAAPDIEFSGHSMVMAVTTPGGLAAAGAYLVKMEVPLAPVFAIGSSRYHIVAGDSWSEAESAALDIGGHLATINSAKEDAALTQIMASDAFKRFYSDLGQTYSYSHKGLDFVSQTQSVALGSAYWIGLSLPPGDGLGQTPVEAVWSSGEESSYRGQTSPNNELNQGLIPLPAVEPMFRAAYAMKIGAGASDQGDWAYTGSVYPTSMINPYTAARGLAETTAQDALHIEGSHFADVLMSDWAGSELKGLGGDDWLLGDLGKDTLIGAAGNDTLAGGAGFDTAVYSGLRSDYTVTLSGNELIVTDKRDTAGNEGIDRLSGIEQLRFFDGDVPVSPSAPISGKAYFWNHTPGRGHALLSGVNLLQVGDDTPSDSPVYLKNGAWDASGRAYYELWLRSAEPVTSFEIDLRLPEILGSPKVSVVTPPQGYTAMHFYDATSSNLRLAGMGLNGFAAGEFKLADISIDLPTTTTSFTLEALKDTVNREEGGPWTASMSRTVTGGDGSYAFTPLDFVQHSLKASRPATDAGPAVSALDALAALKLSAGLNPNTDPDKAGPLTAAPVSPYQLIAADVSGLANGPDGKVTASDALGILKKVLGMPDAPVSAKTWEMLAENADLSGLSRRNVLWDEQPRPTLNSGSAFTQNMIGVLRGDVDGDWRPPAGSSYIESLDPQYFSKLALSMNVSESQWFVL